MQQMCYNIMFNKENLVIMETTMGNGKKRGDMPPYNFKQQKPKMQAPAVTSLLDNMKDGKEYESIIVLKNINVDLGKEINRCVNEISSIRKRPVVCYIANVINGTIRSSISIDNSDDKPFLEMLNSVPIESKDIDILIVTPGGSAETVANFVNRIRARFDHVGFILPYMAMSAGTIFCLSGDEIIMDENAFIGPIDPQVPSRDGRYVPAQSITTLIKDIQDRGQDQLNKGGQPGWSDIQILRNLDPKEIGNSLNASQFSIDLVSDYLENYKFRTWINHSDGRQVTPEDRKKRASEIAAQLCKHSLWLSHARRVSREMAWNTCKLKIVHPEEIDGLAKAIKRFWALMCFSLENTFMFKVFVSNNYMLFRHEQPVQK